MIIDKLNEFCDGTSIVSTVGTKLVGNQIDLTNTGLDIGNGDDTPYLVIMVDEDVKSTGATTVQFKLMSDAQAVIVPATATEHFATSAIAKANLVDGYKVAAVKLPQGEYERYLGIVTVTGTQASTAGSINAFLTMDAPSNKSYPDGL